MSVEEHVQCDRETPRRWVDARPLRWAVQNGMTLGCAATTRIGFSLWYVIPVGALLFGNAALGSVLYGAYGLSRGIGGFGIIVASRRSSCDRVGDQLLTHMPATTTACFIQLLIVGVAGAVVVGA